MSPSQRKTTLRMVIGSFVAGAGAMVLVGLVAPVAMQGGLAMSDAAASAFVQPEPLIAPLDVAAIEAQLAKADTEMLEMRETTADEVATLARLAGR
jgi:hypothetical protein